MLYSILAISLGASVGAVSRWFLGLGLNALFPTIPLGTLAANLIGGYLVGVAVSTLQAIPTLDPVWRLAIITGFLGGLTTFSSFSAEVISMLQQARYVTALGTAMLHVLGSLLLTVLGMRTVGYFLR